MLGKVRILAKLCLTVPMMLGPGQQETILAGKAAKKIKGKCVFQKNCHNSNFKKNISENFRKEIFTSAFYLIKCLMKVQRILKK